MMILLFGTIILKEDLEGILKQLYLIFIPSNTNLCIFIFYILCVTTIFSYGLEEH